MVLFLKDWSLGTAFPDYTTSNTSFTRLAGLYKQMGIENHSWILALYNKSLQGIDPFDTNLTIEQKIAISVEIKMNPVYYFREIARVPTKGSIEPIKFIANRANMGALWLILNHITTLLIQIRQTGKSVFADELATVLMNVILEYTDISLLTKDDDLRVKNIKRIKDMRDTLPDYLRLQTRKDVNNSEKLTVELLGNTYYTAVPQASPKAALALGRGSSYTINFIDEICYIKNIAITLPALLSASGATRDNAKKAGAPYFNLFTTTPGYINDPDGKFVYDNLYMVGMTFTEALFDIVDEEELLTVVAKASKGKHMVVCEFNHRQLGYTDDWLRKKIRDSFASGDGVLADFLNMWPEGSVVSPFSKRLLKILHESKVEEAYNKIYNHGYIIRWYIPSYRYEELTQKVLVAGIDTSEAIGKDDISIVFRDAASGATLGVAQINETNTIVFSDWLVELMQIFPNTLFIIERKSTGVSIIDNILKVAVALDIDPFKRLFNTVVDDADAHPELISSIINRPMTMRDPDVYRKHRRSFGYATAGSGRMSREKLYGDSLLNSLTYTGNKARDSKLIAQISGLRMKNGRLDHSAKEHDDLVIGWVLAYWFLTSANNLKYYNIPTDMVLSAVVTSSTDTTSEIDKRNVEEQIALKKRLVELLGVLKEENDTNLIFKLKNRMLHLYKDIDNTIIQNFHLPALLDEIARNKKINKRHH